jgi:mannose PTS system EIIA component
MRKHPVVEDKGLIGIVIVAHGGLAGEYLSAVEHVVGVQKGMRSIAIGPEDDRAAKQAEICDAADAVDLGHGVVIVTDMFGGSPSNLSLRACSPQNRRILYGANLPMLIKLAKSRHLEVPEAVDAALDAAHKYINSHSVGPA